MLIENYYIRNSQIMDKIDKRITGWAIKKDVEAETTSAIVTPPVQLTKLERGDILHGSTYKVKQPLYWEHGFYITINNTVVNGVLKPFEIFIESKNSECLSLCNVLSLTLTAMFRLQIDIGFLLEEYRSIQDPKGGYRAKRKSWEEKPKYYSSIVGEFADVIEHHIRTLGSEIPPIYVTPTEEELQEVDKVFLQVTAEKGTDIPGAIECPVCRSMSYVLMDGCYTCCECGHSKCS